jgi:hypothetical protein
MANTIEQILQEALDTCAHHYQAKGSLNVKEVESATVVSGDLGGGTDTLYLEVKGLSTPYPKVGHKPVVKVEVAAGYGVEYCKANFGITPEFIGRTS